MRSFWIAAVGIAAWAILAPAAAMAARLSIPLAGVRSVRHDSVRYQCDANAAEFGLPSGPFAATYYHAEPGSELAVLPIKGAGAVLANVVSADGAKYAGRNLVWWTRGDTAFAYFDPSKDGKRTQCRMVPR